MLSQAQGGVFKAPRKRMWCWMLSVGCRINAHWVHRNLFSEGRRLPPSSVVGCPPESVWGREHGDLSRGAGVGASVPELLAFICRVCSSLAIPEAFAPGEILYKQPHLEHAMCFSPCCFFQRGRGVSGLAYNWGSEWTVACFLPGKEPAMSVRAFQVIWC